MHEAWAVVPPVRFIVILKGSDAAVELQNKNTVKMDVWGKALLKARGNEELAKAKYIEIRVKEAKDSAKIEDLN